MIGAPDAVSNAFILSAAKTVAYKYVTSTSMRC